MVKVDILTEGLFNGDLEGLILPLISLNEYEPKIDKNALVVVFFAKHVEAAEDLSVFLEKSANDYIIDTEVSSAPDTDGNYLIFVEVTKNITIEAFFNIIKLTQYLCKLDNLKFQAYKLPKTYSVTEPNIQAYFKSLK